MNISIFDVFINKIIICIIVAVVWGKPSSISKVTSFVVLAEAMYLALIKKVVIVGCFFEDYIIELLVILKTKFLTDL